MSEEHRYVAILAWSGSTGAGYEAYGRAHEVTLGSGTWLITADVPFRGDPGLTNPEQLLVMAAASCQLLSFLAVAARARVDVVAYTDDASGVMPTGNRPMWVTRIDLRPRVTVRGDVDAGRLARLVEVAHRECFIAASLRSEITISPVFVREEG